MKVLESVYSGALLMALLIAWPGGQLLQASDLEEMQQPQEAKIYPHLRDPGVDEAGIRDMTIQSTIRRAYFEDDAIESDRVNVQVDDGVVHLSGTVPSRAALERAEGIAADTENVVSVVNELEVAEDS
jgi:osmotically-inducible protein OsmY